MPAPTSKPVPLEERVPTGTVVDGKYRVERVIGSGGMGIVVAAKHLAMGNVVAIKFLRLDDEDRDPAMAVTRFVREARATARIESEHVVRVSDVSSMPDGTPYMVMELLDGVDLRHVVAQRGQLPIAEAVGYVLQACEGLATAHAAGVIHRDLKPSNIFLAARTNGTRVVKVLDFGISKLAPRAGEAAVTTTTSLMGSPLYMSPEQMRSSRDVDERADVWSLGLILYELLAGDPPFYGETIPEICMAVMSGQPTAITEFRKDVPTALQAILVKCMAKDPRDRYATMAELARALEDFAGVQARVHAERASAAVKSVRRIVSVPPGADNTQEEAGRVGGPPRYAEPPRVIIESRPPPRRQGTFVWFAVAGAASAIGAIVTILIARGSMAPTPVGHAVAPPATVVAAAPVASASVVAAAPTVTTVPFDSLPEAAAAAANVDAGAAHGRVATRPTTRPTASGVSSSGAPAATPSPAPTPASSSDSWKWGDRQ